MQVAGDNVVGRPKGSSDQLPESQCRSKQETICSTCCDSILLPLEYLYAAMTMDEVG